MAVKELGYAILKMQDPPAWGAFAENVLGLKAAPQVGADLRYRMDEAPFRYLIEKSDADGLFSVGWDLGTEQAFNALIDKLNGSGVPATLGDASEAERRAVAAFAFFSDPAGNRVEVFHSRATGDAFTPARGISKFITQNMGLGHVVLPAPDIQAVREFYVEHLGFGDSDDLTLPPFAEGAPDQRIIFLHADNPRHHSLGLY
ncbi:MAG: VOC family protein, partial [Pseudomonadota bacterium]